MQYDSTLIYQRAMELIDLVRVVTKDMPSGYGFLADQLRRAGSSVPLTFAEGYGKESAKDQRRFYMMARGSACEVAAALDVAFRLGVVEACRHAHGRDLCDHLARMLTRFRR